jgi:hemerythrin-like domain-containing protein
MKQTTTQAGADLIDLLLGEHGCILAMIRYQERRLATMGLRELKECGAALEAMLQAHAVEEDQLLFGALGHVPDSVRATLEAMYGEHEEMRALLARLAGQRQAARARRLLVRLMELAREHFAVEERVLFGLVREWIGPDRLRQLGQKYAQRRGLQLEA